MSCRLLVPVFCSVLAVAGFSQSVAAQSAVSQVTLSATVRPQATIERRSMPTVRRRSGDTTEYHATVVVRANTAYRVIARRTAASLAPMITLGVDRQTARLHPDRVAVQVGRGELGVTAFEITYVVYGDERGATDADVVQFEAVPDSPIGN